MGISSCNTELFVKDITLTLRDVKNNLGEGHVREAEVLSIRLVTIHQEHHTQYYTNKKTQNIFGEMKVIEVLVSISNTIHVVHQTSFRSKISRIHRRLLQHSI